MKLSREAQIVVGGAVLYVIFSFLDWQQVDLGIGTYGVNEWHGIGVLAALLALVLLAWEVVRALDVKIELGTLTPGLVSIGLALLLLLFTVITFLSHDEARHWPAWIGLLLSLVIAGVSFVRAQAEGVQMPTMPKNMPGSGGTGSTTSSSPPPPATPPPPSPPIETSPPGTAPEA